MLRGCFAGGGGRGKDDVAATDSDVAADNRRKQVEREGRARTKKGEEKR